MLTIRASSDSTICPETHRNQCEMYITKYATIYQYISVCTDPGTFNTQVYQKLVVIYQQVIQCVLLWRMTKFDFSQTNYIKARYHRARNYRQRFYVLILSSDLTDIHLFLNDFLLNGLTQLFLHDLVRKGTKWEFLREEGKGYLIVNCHHL